MVKDPMCSCRPLEDAYHFLFVCKIFFIARQSLMSNHLSMIYLYIIDVHLLPWGDESLTVIKISKYLKQYKTLCMSVEDSNNHNHFKT